MNPAKDLKSEKIDSLWVNVNLATMTESGPYGAVENGAMAVGAEKIVWLGKLNELPAELDSRASGCL